MLLDTTFFPAAPFGMPNIESLVKFGEMFCLFSHCMNVNNFPLTSAVAIVCEHILYVAKVGHFESHLNCPVNLAGVVNMCEHSPDATIRL